MDVTLLPEIAASATDGYLSGLRDGGWTGSPDAVRATIAACGAAKYSWFAPVIAGPSPATTSASPPTARTAPLPTPPAASPPSSPS
jgi:hypothetical protein